MVVYGLDRVSFCARKAVHALPGARPLVERSIAKRPE
jgi:hypothetical protein